MFYEDKQPELPGLVGLQAKVQNELDMINNHELKKLIGNMLNSTLIPQICGVNMLIDIKYNNFNEQQFQDYLEEIDAYNVGIEAQINSVCCKKCKNPLVPLSAKFDRGYSRLFTFKRFKDEIGNNATAADPYDDLEISVRKIESKGWSGGRTEKAEWIWVTPTDEFEAFLEEEKEKVPDWRSNNYIANMAGDFMGFSRFKDPARPKRSPEPLIRIDFEKGLSVPLYQPNTTHGYWRIQSFYLSYNPKANDNFGRTYCPYHSGRQGKERVHLNHKELSVINSPECIGEMNYDVSFTDWGNEMHKVLEEALKRLFER